MTADGDMHRESAEVNGINLSPTSIERRRSP